MGGDEGFIDEGEAGGATFLLVRTTGKVSLSPGKDLETIGRAAG